MRHPAIRPALFLIALLADAGGAAASQLPGPMTARVERVIDGDTIRVRVQVWIDQELAVNVRLRGVDAPELRARCDDERSRAEAARDFVIALVGEQITLHSIGRDKFFGRVVADVTVADGRDLGEALLAAGHARPYDGGRRESWCGERAKASP